LPEDLAAVLDAIAVTPRKSPRRAARRRS